jgi:hypothetical protein
MGLLRLLTHESVMGMGIDAVSSGDAQTEVM